MNSQLPVKILSGMDKLCTQSYLEWTSFATFAGAISSCYFWMYHLNATFCYTVAVCLQHLKKLID